MMLQKQTISLNIKASAVVSIYVSTHITMQLTNALVLLSVAVCISAQSCASCPQEVDGSSLLSSCVSVIGSYTICL